MAVRLIGRGDGRTLAAAEAERLDVEGDVDREPLAARPVVVGSVEDAPVLVASVAFQGHAASPERIRVEITRRGDEMDSASVRWSLSARFPPIPSEGWGGAGGARPASALELDLDGCRLRPCPSAKRLPGGCATPPMGAPGTAPEVVGPSGARDARPAEPPQMDRFDRIYRLHRIIRSARHPVPRKTLEEKLECSRATVNRAIEDLRDLLWAPLRYDRARNGYYYDEKHGGHPYELPGTLVSTPPSSTHCSPPNGCWPASSRGCWTASSRRFANASSTFSPTNA